MENTNNNIYIKPKEILELEKKIGKELFREDYNEGYLLDSYDCNYCIDNKNNVISLFLCDCNLTSIDFISNFKELLQLGISNNKIQNIFELSKLSKLKQLDLSKNRIKDLNPLKSITSLIEISIIGNDIENFEVLNVLINLKAIILDDVKIKNIDFIEKLSKLEYLSVIGTDLENIFVLERVQKLDILLPENKIKIVPKKVAEKYNLLDDQSDTSNNTFIDINPLEFPPSSVFYEGSAALKAYYEDAEIYDHKALAEGRIIFIGEGASGKTSIIERVINNTFDKNRKQTNGIKIEYLTLHRSDLKSHPLFHIWDFGGQEIQHAVHKFFFTEGCLYVLVLDSRKEEDPEYWLQQIESLGGKASVLVVFNKQDENNTEIADRKYLKEKYPNIIGFYNTSCLTGYGLDNFKQALYSNAVELRTVKEQFPRNWLEIKDAIKRFTSNNQHYLSLDVYKEICNQNNTTNEKAQLLILRYLNTIGAVTWFGDDVHLNMLHVLKPEWITQGVYKILTSKTTANRYGQIRVSDFKELLQPIKEDDYTYEQEHYGFILTMMKKFDLCYTANDRDLLIPSAFGKQPNVEYSDYKGEGIRTYFLQFKDYMPMALMHRFITRNINKAVDRNYWYTGIVIKDEFTDSVSMVHADKEAKRIYIRIKGATPLGAWERIRGGLADVTKNYAKIEYNEMVLLDERTESSVSYNDLLGHLAGNEGVYFDAKLKRRFYVGYLMGMFENKEDTIEKMKNGEIVFNNERVKGVENVRPQIIQILQQNSQQVSNNVSVQIDIDIDVNFVNHTSSEVAGDINYLLGIVDEQNKAMIETLKELLQFATDAKDAKTSSDVVSKGWKRKLKGVVESFGKGAETIKKVKEGGEAFLAIAKGIKELAGHFNIHDIGQLF